MAQFMMHVQQQNVKPAQTIQLNADDQIIAVKQGFHWLAFLFSFLWLLANRLWLWAAVFFGASFVVMLAGDMLGAAPLYVSLALMLLSIYVGLEAGNLRSEGLIKRGYGAAGVIVAPNRDEAILRFVEKRPAAQSF